MSGMLRSSTIAAYGFMLEPLDRFEAAGCVGEREVGARAAGGNGDDHVAHYLAVVDDEDVQHRMATLRVTQTQVKGAEPAPAPGTGPSRTRGRSRRAHPATRGAG